MMPSCQWPIKKKNILWVSSSILPQVLQTLLKTFNLFILFRYLLVLNKAGKRERKAIVYVSYRPKVHEG